LEEIDISNNKNLKYIDFLSNPLSTDKIIGWRNLDKVNISVLPPNQSFMKEIETDLTTAKTTA
jgi:hypothetical protein